MASTIQESAIPEVDTPCEYCDRVVSCYDRISDGSKSCLSCSYANGFEPSLDCIYHPKEFNLEDKESQIDLVRVAQVDIDRADKDICTVEMVIPEDMHPHLAKLMDAHQSSINAELIAALSWYTLQCLADSEKEEAKLNGSILSETPEEIKQAHSSLDDLPPASPDALLDLI